MDELAREGACRMIATALDVEVQEFLEELRPVRDDQGHAVALRNGRERARTMTLAAGAVEIGAPRP